MDEVGAETREKKFWKGIGRLVLRRQVTEIPSEKTLGTKWDRALDTTKVPVSLQEEGLEAGKQLTGWALFKRDKEDEISSHPSSSFPSSLCQLFRTRCQALQGALGVLCIRSRATSCTSCLLADLPAPAHTGTGGTRQPLKR